MKFRAVSAALAVSMMVAAPAASAQTMMTGAQARAEMERYCSQNAQRTDEAGRSWYAANCTAESLARYDMRSRIDRGAAATAGIFGLAAAAIAILVK